MYRLPVLIVLLLAGAALAAFALLRGDDRPSYGPLEIEGDPFVYESGRQKEFEARAAAGHSHVVYAKSPGGVLASARRVERWRDRIEEVAHDSGVDAGLIEGMVFLESAGRPDVAASGDLEGAVGLTQILAETATSLLGMHVDVRRSERLTRRLRRARGPKEAARLRAKRRRVDERFDPEKSLAATGRYLKRALDEFGREDLAVVSYHMGIGNLQSVLGAYGDNDPSYAQVFFDTAPNRHPRAYRLLTGLGDDSKTYLWRVLASHEVMRLYRENRPELERLALLHAAAPSGEQVLHPPGRTEVFQSQDDLDAAYVSGDLRSFPDDPVRYGLRRDPRMGEPLYRGLRTEAFALAVYTTRGVRNVSGTKAPLTVGLMLASPAAAQTPPNLPNLPTTDVERFKMTIHGSQFTFFAFSFTLPPSSCTFHSEGQISEDWEFARGKGVVMEFSKLGPRVVFLRRVGRPLGDAAFAAPGALKREANGFFDFGPDPCGGIHQLRDEAACGAEFEVNSDLRLVWNRGRLTLERGGTRLVENPAATCGRIGGTGGNFDLFTWPYPLLAKQRVEFSKKQIFGRKRGFRLVLKDKFLAPLREPVYESVEEKLTGETVLTFKRLRH